MQPEQQAELWMALRDRMKNDWHDLSFHERKAGKCTLRSASVMEPPLLSWALIAIDWSYRHISGGSG